MQLPISKPSCILKRTLLAATVVVKIMTMRDVFDVIQYVFINVVTFCELKINLVFCH